MSGIVDVNALISVACAFGGFVICYQTFIKGSKKDAEAHGQQMGQLLSDLGYVKAGVDDIKGAQREQQEFNIKVSTRLALVENRANDAHTRIDKLEDKLG